jgi:hypothetical protein
VYPELIESKFEFIQETDVFNVVILQLREETVEDIVVLSLIIDCTFTIKSFHIVALNKSHLFN